MKKALITGITGQDGSYLAELLLSKGYEVNGIYRRGSTDGIFDRIEPIRKDINLYCADLTDLGSLEKVFAEVKPDEVYNLAAQSHVGISFNQAAYTMEVNWLGVERLLDCMKKYVPNAKFYQACHDSKTNVISEKGIVKYTSLNEGDLVYTYNLKTKEIELKPIIKKFEYAHNGKMLCIKNRRIDKMVTLNHNLLLKKDNEEVTYCKAEKLIDFLPYERNSKISLVKPEIKMEKRDSKEIDLNLITDLTNISKNHTKNLINKMNSNDLLYLLGLYIGDGFCKNEKIAMTKSLNNENLLHRNEKGKFKKIESKVRYEKKYPSSYIQFAIPKDDPARKKLIKVLKRNKIIFKEHYITVDFSSFNLSKIFKTCGIGVFNKHIPKWVWDMPDESLYYLKEGLIDSDGHIRKKDKRESFCTSSKFLLKDSIVLFLKLGFFCSVYTREAKKLFFKSENRYINGKENYIINIAKKQTNKIYRQNIKNIPYKGKVWCLQIKDNNNFLVERNGKISFCGNSTSELFGKVLETPQSEKTPFNPVSPYGFAKLKAHEAISREREKGMFACAGILFNHETVADFMPLFIKEGKMFDIKPFYDILTFIDKNKKEYQSKEISGIKVLGKNGWTKIKYASGYPHNLKKDNKSPKFISGRCGSYIATGSHIAFMEKGEKKTAEIKKGDKFEKIDFKIGKVFHNLITKEEAELIGMLVADGYINQKSFGGKFTKNNKEIRKRFYKLWKKVVGTKLKEVDTPSGFKKGNFVKQVLFKPSDFTKSLDIYTSEREKRIPKRILNANKELQMAFLRGYNNCDGLKKDKCVYEFKAFKTNSATLAQGLWYLTDVLLANQRKTFYTFNSNFGSIIYCINFNSPNSKGNHLSKEFTEVTKVTRMDKYEGWFYDVETESKEFIAGVGNIHVHNSPCRGLEFVTRKISDGIARIKFGIPQKETGKDYLELGNLNAKRDWGFSGDYVKAMWLMLQQNKPKDYIISTGETRTVRDFVEIAANYAGIDITWKGKGLEEEGYDQKGKKIIGINKDFFRPNEVNLLLGDSSKARKELGWKPNVNFNGLVKMMVKEDLDRIEEQVRGERFSQKGDLYKPNF